MIRPLVAEPAIIQCKVSFSTDLSVANTGEAWSVFKLTVRMLAYSVFAGLCTLLIYVIFIQFLPSESILITIPLVLSWQYALERILFGPALETLLLFPFALAFISLWELKPSAAHYRLGCHAGPSKIRLFVASGILAVLFTLTHVLTHGVLAWATLPASWLIMLWLLTPLSKGQLLHAMLSSLMIHCGHNGLLLCAALLTSFSASPAKHSETLNSLTFVNEIYVPASSP